MSFLSVIVASILSLFNFSQLAGVSATVFSFGGTGSAQVLFAGDMMFDRTIRTTAEKQGDDFLLSCIEQVLLAPENDLVVANLEGPITGQPSKSIGSKPGEARNFVFTFPMTTAQLLKDHKIDLVNLGNNHILNFGYSGVQSTVTALDGAGVEYFGDPIGDKVAYKIINGVPLAFISYNEFSDDGAKTAAAVTMIQIKSAKSIGFLPIVYTHWGPEYLTKAPQYIRDRAHSFVDAGAIAVIGSHPHVVQDNEIYTSTSLDSARDKSLGTSNSGLIYYSLGNFVFDQYFQESVRNGLLIRVTFSNQGIEGVEEIPVTLNTDRTVCPKQ